MSVVCVVQARMGSSRLPGKSLRALGTKPIIQHVVERAKAIRGVGEVVLATSTSASDDALYRFAVEHLECDIIRGPERDVLLRFSMAAQSYPDADVVMRITGDCPFLAPDVCSEVLDRYFDNPLGATFVGNDTTCSGYPDGMDVEIFSLALLLAANTAATDPLDREHVTRWMRRTVCTATVKSDSDWSRFKLSVDTEVDYDYARQVYARLPKDDWSMAATMRAVEACCE